jgi:hypothetical protein
MPNESPDITKLLARANLIVDHTGPALICQTCQYALAVSGTQVTSHLRAKHQTPLHLRSGLTKCIQTLGLPDPATIGLRNDGSPAHLWLQVCKGHACRQCDYRTTSLDLITRHVQRVHSKALFAFDDVFLQSWTHSASRKYWIVRYHGSLLRLTVNPKVQAHLESVQQRESSRLERRNEACVDTKDLGVQTSACTRPWMERTRWAITYKGVDRSFLQRLTSIPDPCFFDRGYLIRPRSCPEDLDIVSSGQDEQKIASLMAVIDRMFDRCEETMQHTSHLLLRWLRSTTPQTCYPKPFTLVALEASRKKYRRYWKRFIAFCFRGSRMDPEMRSRHMGLRFTERQLIQLREIWEHESWSGIAQCDTSRCAKDDIGDEETEEEEDDDDNNGGGDNDVEDEEEVVDEAESEEDDENREEEGVSMVERNATTGQRNGAEDALLELAFQLSIDFSIEPFIDGQPSSSLLVFFSGILGFSADARTFLPAKQFTTCLSGLIYVQRLLFLEYALPYKAYTYLRIPRRSWFRQHKKLNSIRESYMIAGSPTPLEEWQNLRDFGRRIAQADTPAVFIRWSDDGQTLFHGDKFSLGMQGFQDLARHFLFKAEGLCKDLMFGLKPAIDLAKVKDDLSNVQSGFSFVQHPGNCIAKLYLELSRKACTNGGNGLFQKGGWDWKAIFLYWKRGEQLLEMLMCLLYMLGGQVPRGPELFSIEYQNGPLTERGIYVYNGYMVYVIRHHKAKRSTNREFNVARFLPIQVGHILYKYLVYIRPLIEMLHREQSHRPEAATSPPSRLLFQSDPTAAKPWDPSRLTSALKKATQEVWGEPINSRIFRQICIGVTEKHVVEVHKPFNRFDDRSSTADRNVVFSWQSGHRPIQRASAYGLDGAFPSKLQPALLRIYEWASVRWHEFLHQPSRVLPEVEGEVPLRAQDVQLQRQTSRPSPAESAELEAQIRGTDNSGKRKSREGSCRLTPPIQHSIVAPTPKRQRLAAPWPTEDDLQVEPMAEKMLQQWRGEIREQLARWSGRCPLCHMRKEIEQQHRLQDCQYQDEATRIWKKFRHIQRALKGRNYNNCFHCWLPDLPGESDIHSLLNGEWKGSREGSWSCRYKGVGLLVFLTILQECKDIDVKCDLLDWMENEDCDVSKGKGPTARLCEMTSLVRGLEGADVPMVLKLFHRFGRAIR